jgi:hypothetical protein
MLGSHVSMPLTLKFEECCRFQPPLGPISPSPLSPARLRRPATGRPDTGAPRPRGCHRARRGRHAARTRLRRAAQRPAGRVPGERHRLDAARAALRRELKKVPSACAVGVLRRCNERCTNRPSVGAASPGTSVPTRRGPSARKLPSGNFRRSSEASGSTISPGG